MEPTWGEVIFLAVMCIITGAAALWLIIQSEMHR